jgi:hypothetical protein
MALSMDNEISANDISSLVRFKQKKVVLLRGYGFDSLVVKIESASEGHVKSATTVVKAIDPANRMKILSAREIQELTTYLSNQKSMLRSLANASGHFFGAASLENDNPGLKDLQDLLAERQRMTGAGVALCKMDQANLVGMDKALVARWTQGETEQDPLNKFKSALLARGGMERLGEIIAADLFIANRDRFNAWGGPFTAWVDEHGPNERALRGMKTFHNIGNILLCLTDRGPVMSGLDYVDPNGQGGGMSYKEWNGVVATEQMLNETWDGRILPDKRKRREFASDVVDDIDWLLQACPTPRPTVRVAFPGNGSDAERRLEKGMIEGCRKIAAKLKLKIKQYEKQPAKTKFLAGMNERYKIIKNV